MIISADTAMYIACAASNWHALPPAEFDHQVTDRCPECDDVPSPLNPDDGHIVLDVQDHPRAGQLEQVVLVGCEGYWMINPNRIGMGNRPEWSTHDGSPFWDGTGVDPFPPA